MPVHLDSPESHDITDGPPAEKPAREILTPRRQPTEAAVMPWKRPARRSPVAAATLVLALAGSQVGCSRTTAPAATEGAPATSHPPGFAIEEGGAGPGAGTEPGEDEPLPVGEGDSWGVAISPDGKYLAAG